VTAEVAVLGMACRFPDAVNPEQLWGNVLAQRQAFRKMPAIRLSHADYFSPGADGDTSYPVRVAVLDGFEFDRDRFRIAGKTFRETDLVHWLALDVAGDALAKAGFAEGVGLPRESTAVIVGNTLTGELSRAATLRLRWPYVRKTLETVLADRGFSSDEIDAVTGRYETVFKAPFPEVGDESLAGGLSNTIAGRICNYFDFGGGGYVVDGACSSSLLAISTAAVMLTTGAADVAVAGGVDLSLDPFELVGFAKMGALTHDRMRVYDSSGDGFSPGEGAGFVVLARADFATSRALPVHAWLRGWGVSSDGAGGLTRPERDGQRLALRRAYAMAGIAISRVDYFEGHGTGTVVGDATELAALNAERAAASASAPAAVGSVKANIGHTKAAAGVAGFIKAVTVLERRVLPPATGVTSPHPEILGPSSTLRVLDEPEAARPGPLYAGVSSFGFGGINAHVVLESGDVAAGRDAQLADLALGSSNQDCELLVLSASDRDAMVTRLEKLREVAAHLSDAELTDVAVDSIRTLPDDAFRCALVTERPEELATQIDRALAALETSMISPTLDESHGVFVGVAAVDRPRIGFLFSGQAAPSRRGPGTWGRRFPIVRELYSRDAIPASGDTGTTDVAQPAIVTSSLAALRVLDGFDLEGAVGVGHSLGELTALHWAGSIDETDVQLLARDRGRIMASINGTPGRMAGIGLREQDAAALVAGHPVVVAAVNAPTQTVIAGAADAVATIVNVAKDRGIPATALAVSHAFHSPLMKPAVGPWSDVLATVTLRGLKRLVASTITGQFLDPEIDLRDLLVDQLTAPVRFSDALGTASPLVDCWIEVGPGHILSDLAIESGKPSVSVDACASSLRGLLTSLAMIHVLGGSANLARLADGRLARPVATLPRGFIGNPCDIDGSSDQRPRSDRVVVNAELQPAQPRDALQRDGSGAADPASTLEVVRELVARFAELTPASIDSDATLLGDLHLNSIAVAQIAVEAARTLGLAPLSSPADFATATVVGLADALTDLSRHGQQTNASFDALEGSKPWSRFFESVEGDAGAQARAGEPATQWAVVGPGAHHDLGSRLREALPRAERGTSGLLIIVERVSTADLPEIHAALQAAALAPARSVVALVTRNAPVSGMARSLSLERPDLRLVVVDATEAGDSSDVVNEIADPRQGFSEIRLTSSGARLTPGLRLRPVEPSRAPLDLAAAGVVVVTGGANGIAAECGAAVAEATGVRLLVLGRSDPGVSVTRESLRRYRARGIEIEYRVADVTDNAALNEALRGGPFPEAPVVGVIHGAGINVPRPIVELDLETFERTVRTKVDGARHLLESISADHLRFFVSFGSIIARTGMAGEADYALANEWLRDVTLRLASRSPECRAVTLEWSVWSGSGMGERLGRVDALARQGVAAIPVDIGVEMFLRGLQTLPSGAFVVSGRLGTSTGGLIWNKTELPLRRFLEYEKVSYPGVELVVDAELSVGTDLYVNDHVLDGVRLWPAAIGIEAMAQVASSLSLKETALAFQDLRLSRPIVVGVTPSTIRIAGVVGEDSAGQGSVDVVVRSAETLFASDHFRATVSAGECDRTHPDGSGWEEPLLPTPTELYGPTFFQSGRFARVSRLRSLHWQSASASIDGPDVVPYFAAHLPTEMVLGAAGVRDAAIHFLQASLADMRVLPVRVGAIFTGRLDGPVTATARQVAGDRDSVIYDVTIHAVDGRRVECWHGLELRRVSRVDTLDQPCCPQLIGPVLEREAAFAGADKTMVWVVPARISTDAFVSRWIDGRRALRRADGRPELADRRALSMSRTADLTLACASIRAIGCDIELIQSRRPEVWSDLVDDRRLHQAAVALGCDADEAGTRIWGALEALKKAQAPIGPMTFEPTDVPGFALLRSGDFCVLSLRARLATRRGPLTAVATVAAQP
jgi:enediyne polyketide synthase